MSLVQRGVKGGGLWRLAQRVEELRGHLEGAGGTVSSRPSSVGLGGLHGGEAGGLHPALACEAFDVAGVDLRPRAGFAAARESLQPRLLVAALFLSIDPTVAQSDIEGFRVGYGRPPAAFLEDAQPEPRVFRVMLRKPLLELPRARKRADGFAVRRGKLRRSAR
jgi:hypothetical protein